MKTAIVHDWLVSLGGSEKVAEILYELYPSPVFTLVKDDRQLRGSVLEHATIHTSFLQKLPWARTKYAMYLPLFPLAVEQFDLSGYDVVLSSSHAVSKGVLTAADQIHICYCHTPIRYGWDLYHQYLRQAGLHKGWRSVLARMLMMYIRMWDVASANRVDHYVANSHYVARRIYKIYRQRAHVIYPPVDVDQFKIGSGKEDFYVTASRLVPYKRIDLIVEAFSRMPDRKLLVLGEGPELGRIKSKASRNTEILGYQSQENLRLYLQKARAFVFAADEDFGILPVEAQCCGTPVIAYGKGGALETVTEKTGIFFEEQTAESISRAVEAFEKQEERFDPATIRKNAERFGKQRFCAEFRAFVTEIVERRSEKAHLPGQSSWGETV